MNVAFVAFPLLAQSIDVADSTVPATPAAPSPQNPPPAATPPAQQTSAATTQSGSALSAVSPVGNSSAVGLSPVSGPGSQLTPILGDHLGSAFTNERIPFRVTATLAEVYADNIFGTPHKTYDYITRLKAQGEYQVGNLTAVDGNYLDALYSPSLHLYAIHSHETGVDQDVDVLYAHHFSRLTLSLEQIYSSIQSTNASIGGIVTTDEYKTQAKADFVYSNKLDLVSTVNQVITDYDAPGYTDSRKWTGEIYALYHLDDKLSFGLGPHFGYVILKNEPDQYYQQLLGRVIYAPNEKLTVQAAAGGEYREYQTVARSDTFNPVFELTANYSPESTTMPNPPTNLSLHASRAYNPSYGFAGDDYINTNVYLAATQRFLRNYYFGLLVGYENDDYKYVAANAAATHRVDDYYYIQPTATWKPNDSLAVAAFDKYEEDDSNIDLFAYNANQFGLSVTATY